MSAKDITLEEREEGEITDEFEDIISSDEEFSMRQRIEELEAKNAELEKIANISVFYGSESYGYNKDLFNHLSDRYPLVSIDISDDEDYPPAPSMQRVPKREKSIQNISLRRKVINNSNSSHRRRKQSSSPPPAPLYRPSDKFLLSMFHERVTAEQSSYVSKKKRKSKKSHSTRSCRKSREYHISDSDNNISFDTYNVDIGNSYENIKNSDGDRSYSLNRDELRLALARNSHRNQQHASLKDRLIRKKENTDILNEKTIQDLQEIVKEETKAGFSEQKTSTDDNLEEQELRIIALRSAVIRKHLVRKKRNENIPYSPSDFDEIYANIAPSPSINNINETEPCNSMEISPVPSPKIIISDDDGMDTKPVDMDIVNSDSDCELPSYEKWVPIEQIPLPNSMAVSEALYVPTPLRFNHVVERSSLHSEIRAESASMSPINLESEMEEEELALRTLLLAKINSPKVHKTVPMVQEVSTPDPDVSLEAETLRSFLINNMKKKAQPKHSTASVLKEAVRRLTARNSTSSPLDAFSEVKSNQTVAKSQKKAENVFDKANLDMARVQIGLRDNVKHKEGIKEIFSGNVEANKVDVKMSSVEANSSILNDRRNTLRRLNKIEKELSHPLIFVENVNGVNPEPSEILIEQPTHKKDEKLFLIKDTTLCKDSVYKDTIASRERQIKKETVSMPDVAVFMTTQQHKSMEILHPNVKNVTKKPEEEVIPVHSKDKTLSLKVQALISIPVTEKSIDFDTGLKLHGECLTKEEIQTKQCHQNIKSTHSKILGEPMEIKSKSKNEKSISIKAPNIVKSEEMVTEHSPSHVGMKTEKLDKLISKKTNNQLLQSNLLPVGQKFQKAVPKALANQMITTRTKIVKPNKVINHPATDLKRKTTDNIAKIQIKKSKVDESQSRLITSAEMPKVKKLVIQLGASDSESESSDTSADRNNFTNVDDSRVESLSNNNITIGNEYNDISSPISLPMESPCDTPTRRASPIASDKQTTHPTVEKSIVNDFFEAQLDKFLKNVRSKVSVSAKKPISVCAPVVAALSTPVAVRHLPEASQQEYRRLIHRMKMLERQKQIKNLQVIVKNSTIAEAEEISNTLGAEADSKTLVRKVLVKDSLVNTTKSSFDVKLLQEKVSLQQKAVEKKVNTDLIPDLAKSLCQQENTSSTVKSEATSMKPSKENLLVLYENSYHQIGTSILSNLDKSIELVLVAKKAKMAKLKHEYRLRELRKEMEEEQRNLEEHQERIKKIYPEICTSHRMIESLKARRIKINKAVTALGQSVIGSNYSINSDQRPLILEKTKKLAEEIKFVNTMTLTNIKNWETICRKSQDNTKNLNLISLDNSNRTPPLIKEVPLNNSDSKTTAVTDIIQKIQSEQKYNFVPKAQPKDEGQTSTYVANGHEEVLEIEPIFDKERFDFKAMGEKYSREKKLQISGAKLMEYVSPLNFLRDRRKINPNGIVCPYQLMGQCDDKDCKYVHLDE